MFNSTQLSFEQTYRGNIVWATPRQVLASGFQGHPTKGTVLLVRKKHGGDSLAMQTIIKWFEKHPAVRMYSVYADYVTKVVHLAQIAEKALAQFEEEREAEIKFLRAKYDREIDSVNVRRYQALQDQLAHLTRTAGGILDDVQTLTKSVAKLDDTIGLEVMPPLVLPP